MKYYRRNQQEVLLAAVKQFRVVVLTGARQTGKSTLLKHLFNKTHHYVSLDDPKTLRLAQEDPELFFDQYPPPLIIDEIQYAPQLLKYVKILVDKNQKKGQFLITGSQQFTLTKGLQETLAGRAVLFNLLPMSILEGKVSSRNYASRALNGSYPEVVSQNQINAEQWYGSYLSTYIERDVQMHYQLEKVAAFKDFVFLLASRCSQILNYQSLSNDLGVSVKAIRSWIRILEISQIIYLLKPYYVNLGSRITKSPKVYFTDIGLVSYLTGNTKKADVMRGPMSGALFENFVVQETIKFYCNRGKRPPLYYYRTNNGLEVDLMLEEKQGVISPYEIKLSKTPHPGMLRGIERLRNLNKKKNIHITDGGIISLVDQSIILTRSDKAWNLEDFLTSIN